MSENQNENASENQIEDAEPEARQLRLRRAPRYRAFGLTGAVVGVLAGLFLALSFSVAGDYTLQSIIGYLAATLGMLGAVLGLGLAVLIERRQVSR